MKQLTLASFSAERRITAIALFSGMHLEGIRLRHLGVEPSKASDSVRELVTQTLEHHRPEFVAISCPATKAGDRTRAFCELTKEIATSLGIPVIEVQHSALMDTYAHPPVTRKEHVRRIGRNIWPSLNTSTSTRAAVDASTAGLYVQTERLFSQYEVDA